MVSIRQQVLEYCAHLGVDRDYIQGAGGNVSWKEGSTLWIKASGAWLADALERDIFVGVDLSAYRSNIQGGNFGENPPLLHGNGNLRASIETLFHAIFPQAVVVHTHLIDALFYLVKVDAERQLEVMSETGLKWAFVDYAKPGADLGESIWRVVNGRTLDVVFLANHGVVIGGDTVFDVRRKYEILRRALGVKLPNLERPSPEARPEMTALGYEMLSQRSFHLLGRNERHYDRLSKDWALYPDHVVFLGAKAHRSPNLNAAVSAVQIDPCRDYMIVKGEGVFTRTAIEKNKLEMLDLYVRMLDLTGCNDNIKSLSDVEIASLLNWDAEKYRQAMAK